jgi:hypothetical protein
MMGGLSSFFAGLLGRSDLDAGVPAMDGLFKPNTKLDSAELVLSLPGLDSIVSTSTRLFCGSGNELIEISITRKKVEAKTVKTFVGEVTFVTARRDGFLALGVAGEGVWFGLPEKLQLINLAPELNSCLTAAAFNKRGNLLVTVGSTAHTAADWKRDLMTNTASGELIAIDAATHKQSQIANSLAYPYGVIELQDGRIAFSESWRHRIISTAPDGDGSIPLVDDLPAYPARLQPSSDGGFWLALFAPRRQLFEFIMRERDYCESMMSEVKLSEWVGPVLSSSIAPNQPMTKGLVRQMGILKPWAPSQSYGLIAKYDASGHVRATYHSRADGLTHGITDICEHEGDLFIISKGAGALLRLRKQILGEVELP